MSIKKFINQIQTFSFYLEFRLFLAGLFFLASAPSVALLLFLYPIFIGLKKNYKNLLEDKLNYFLIAASIVMTSKSIFTSLKDLNQLEDWNSILNWAGLGNWIPLFLIYFGVQIYVQNPRQRAMSSKALILGTVPVIFSCFSQYFLDWYGPYELFNGFIIWYQRTRTELYQPITGLFNNPNYTGAWLALIWPLLLNYLSQKKKDGSKTKFTIVFSFSVFFIIAIGLINSRAAWLGILASIPLLFGHSVIIWLIPLLLFILFSILFCALPIFSENIKDFASQIIILDSFSTDKTVEIAHSYGVEIFQRNFKNFGNQWNYACQKLPISQPWTMKLDPDERLSEQLKRDISNTFKKDKYDYIIIPRRLWFMNKPLPVKQNVERIWKTGKCVFGDEEVNERPIISGKKIKLKSFLDHYDSPNLHHWYNKQNIYSTLEAKSKFLKNKYSTNNFFKLNFSKKYLLRKIYDYSLFKNQLVFIYCFFFLGAFRAGKIGYIWSKLRSDVYRMRDIKFFEMQIMNKEYEPQKIIRGKPNNLAKKAFE